MKRNVQKPSLPRTSAARNMRLGLVALALGITGSSIASTVPNADAIPAPPAKHPRLQVGKASWYGKLFNGRRTASGERFNMNALTCAHRSLPLGSWVRVTNLINKKSVFLRVNDRGPVPRNRIMDLSYAAARKLGIDGLARVSVEPMQATDPQIAQAMLPEDLPMKLLQVDSTSAGVPILPTLIALR